MKPGQRWLQPPQHGMLSLFLFSLSLIPSFLNVTPTIAEFGAAGFVITKVPSFPSDRRENQARRHNTGLGFIGPRVTNRRFEQDQVPHRSIWASTRDAVSLESRTPVFWGKQGGRSPERRPSTLADVTTPAADVFDKRQSEIPPGRLDVPHDLPERAPFDLDLAAFLANFAFETYRSPGRMAWEVQGASDCDVHFKNGKVVSKVFPGLLTVSLLAVEGLPSFADTEGDENISNKPDRVVDPSISMVLSGREMSSESQTSTKRISPGGRYWGELFSMHVHDPESSVLELWLLDRRDWGAIPQSMRDIFGSTGGHALVGSSKVVLSQVLRSMTGGLEDSWSGWVEMEPVNKIDRNYAGGGDDTDGPAVVTSSVGENSEREMVKIQLDLRFAPMDRYHFDVPHASKEGLAGAKGSRSETTGRQEFASELARGADTVAASEQDHPTRSHEDHSSTASTGVSDSTDPLFSAPKNDLRKEDVAMPEMDSHGGSERPIVLRKDGMPDWDVLTDRLPRQRKDFELTCFIENHETDTQVYVWMDHTKKRLIIAFRGTEAWKDLLTDANFLLDELDHAEKSSILPPVSELVEVVKNTTASWKKPRVKSLPETLNQEKENMLHNINKVFDNSMDLLRNLNNFSEPNDTPTAASTPELNGTPDPGSHEERILSAVQGALKLASVEPASASENSILEPVGNAERGDGGKNESTAVAFLEHGSDGQPARGEASDGSGDLLRRLEEVKQKILSRLGSDDADSGENTTALALKPDDDGVLASSLAWVQEVAGEQMQAINEVMESVTSGGNNATFIETLAPVLRDQQDMLEATRDLVAKMTEFRSGFEAPGGLDDIQEQGKNIINEKINDLRSMLGNTTSTDEIEDTPKIHAGFKTAYLSVNKTLSAVVWGATDGKPEDWHLFITGHSLGGALGTLAALDHARRYPTARVSMYNYGSPRVGNRAFTKVYDSFVGDSFRVVNNMDVVARMPRGTMGRLLLDYRHAGRTVMVDEDPVEPAWIEGESEGECPLNEDDPVTSIWAEGSKATEFLGNELKMMEALFTGKGIDHHLEPCYFSALDSFYTKEDGIETA